MRSDWHRQALDAAVRTIDTHAEALSELDAAIGDGDHGINMKRGFRKIAEASGELASLPPGPALHKAGMTLVMSVGGASGPLYGSLLMAMGKAAGEAQALDCRLASNLVAAGVAAVKSRGKSDAGAKTMLDVLVPVETALRQAVESDLAPAEAARCAREAAERGLEATRPMLATKGRASFLGERSIGHLDPGAMSSYLLVKALCELVGARP